MHPSRGSHRTAKDKDVPSFRSKDTKGIDPNKGETSRTTPPMPPDSTTTDRSLWIWTEQEAQTGEEEDEEVTKAAPRKLGIRAIMR